jgi:hypothetical protein
MKRKGRGIIPLPFFVEIIARKAAAAEIWGLPLVSIPLCVYCGNGVQLSAKEQAE